MESGQFFGSRSRATATSRWDARPASCREDGLRVRLSRSSTGAAPVKAAAREIDLNSEVPLTLSRNPSYTRLSEMVTSPVLRGPYKSFQTHLVIIVSAALSAMASPPTGL
jgi:hypothetical protein